MDKMPEKNELAAKMPEKNESASKLPMELKIDFKTERKADKADDSDSSISQEKLQEAIIWSEILGKPLSRRRKRRQI
jgi:hypothetical protein